MSSAHRSGSNFPATATPADLHRAAINQGRTMDALKFQVGDHAKRLDVLDTRADHARREIAMLKTDNQISKAVGKRTIVLISLLFSALAWTGQLLIHFAIH